uniref:CCHC-type domain-containing protein n=1 Tax=Tanacetum cinerariifolium TaxID=118510 RepID=A0A699JDG2_TANCI|nr:hypothetical protein [Tanacetum cinerariifolium]
MSRDVLTVGSTMRISLLYRGEYSQWSERFMNYLEEQTDGEAMINCIKNGDQPLPRVTQKCGYSKDNCELNFKFLNNLGLEWKQYATMMRQNKNLMDINIDALYNILKQNQRDVNDAMGLKKKTVVVTSDPLALIAEKTKASKRKEKVVVSSDSEGSDADDFSELKKITEYVKSDDKKVEKKDDEKKRDMSKVKCYNCKKEGHFAKDCKKAKVKDYEYYKTKMLLAKKDKDEQVSLAEDQAWMESSSDSDQEINANMVFMAQIEKVLLDSQASSSSANDKISEVSYYLSKAESESEYETSEYYDNTTTYGDVNDAMGSKKKTVVVTSDPLALIAEKIKVSKSNEKVVVSSDSEGSEVDDFSELKKITALLAKAFNRRKFYSKPTNNNLRTSSSSQFANKKQEFVKTGDKKEDKKADEKKRDMSKVKCYNCKKEGHFAKDAKKPRSKTMNITRQRCCLQRKTKMNKFFWLKTKLGWSPVVILIRKSMQTWSSWLKLRKFFQIQRLAHRLLMKRFLRYHIIYLNQKVNLSMRLQNIMIILLIMVCL